MRRRDFLSLAAGGTAYSLLVRVDEPAAGRRAGDRHRRRARPTTFGPSWPASRRRAICPRAGRAEHEAGRAGLRRAGGRRRIGRRLRGGGRGPRRGQGGAGARSLAAGRQFVERNQDARRRRQRPHRPPRLARRGLDRGVPPRRRGQQSAALFRAVGPAALRQSASASRT